MSRSIEIWKDIPSYEGLYQASNYGNIKRLHKDYRCKPYKILKPQKSGNYYTVTLSKNGISVQYTVHYLIAKTFILNVENKSQINHKDGNKLNNTIENLEWVSNSENTKHAYDNNLYHFNGKNSYPVVLYDKDYNYIKTYRSIRALCNFTGFNRKTVSAILNNSKINNYNYNFEYAKEGPSTIEMVRIINSNNRVE